jgi:hypothetical protein
MQFARRTGEGRLFGLDIWDWSLLLGGFLLVGFVALVVA